MLKSYLSKDSDADDGSATVMSSIIYRQAQVAAKAHKAIFDGKVVFENPKDHEIIGRLISYVTDDDSIILDSFGGSGTTAHAILEQNSTQLSKRKFILVEIDKNTAVNITNERIRRVIEGYNKNGDVSQPVKGLGSGFRFCTLGEPLFDEYGNLNPVVTFQDLAAHVFFCDTGSPIPARASDGNPLIGTFQGRAIYLLHAPEAIGLPDEGAGNVLTMAALGALPLPSADFIGNRVVYGEGCSVPDDRLNAAGVTFKQIPYQIQGR